MTAARLEAEERVTAWRRLGSLWRIGVAVLLCLSPLTAILVLGWLMRTAQRDIQARRRRLQNPGSVPRPSVVNWVMAEGPGVKGLARWTGALWQNIRHGTASLVAIAGLTLPFTVLWLFSWWGGWENSFQKGYEQSWVGPTIGLTGVVLALPT